MFESKSVPVFSFQRAIGKNVYITTDSGKEHEGEVLEEDDRVVVIRSSENCKSIISIIKIKIESIEEF